MSVVCAENISKTYWRGGQGTQVLKGVNLTIEQGTCVFLAGASGSGKTTLLSILGCILTPDEGHIELLGQNLSNLSPSERIIMRRDHIGFVFQKFNLIRGLTALENVGTTLMLRGVSPVEARKQSTPLMEMVGLSDKLNSQPKNLSSGECQRVAIARSLANNPDIILADEPTASLDANNGNAIMELLKGLKTQGKTVIVVTHDQRIFPFADHIYHLEYGKIIATP
jgi:putative ABC transport system ATP-binding protein